MSYRGALLLLGMLLGMSLVSRAKAIEVSAARTFFRQATSEQQKTFRQYTLEDQFGLFLFGSQVRHPPALYLARCFALNGSSAVELLRARLGAASDDLTVRDIAVLLATIDEMRIYDVAGDAQLLNALRNDIARMRDDNWREVAQQEVQNIGRFRSRHTPLSPECG